LPRALPIAPLSPKKKDSSTDLLDPHAEKEYLMAGSVDQCSQKGASTVILPNLKQSSFDEWENHINVT
jgi:hypothetical protein